MIVFNQQLASNKIEEEELLIIIDLLFFVVVVVCVEKKLPSCLALHKLSQLRRVRK